MTWYLNSRVSRLKPISKKTISWKIKDNDDIEKETTRIEIETHEFDL